jgi:hypothetical protein
MYNTLSSWFPKEFRFLKSFFGITTKRMDVWAAWHMAPISMDIFSGKICPPPENLLKLGAKYALSDPPR